MQGLLKLLRACRMVHAHGPNTGPASAATTPLAPVPQHPPTLPNPSSQTEVRAVAFVPGQPHAISAATGERHVAVWDVPPAKKSKKQHPAVTTLSLEEPAVAVDAACVSEGETFSVGAVSEGGEAYVWVCHRDSAGGGDADGGDATGGSRASLACQLVMRLRVGDGSAAKG